MNSLTIPQGYIMIDAKVFERMVGEENAKRLRDEIAWTKIPTWPKKAGDTIKLDSLLKTPGVEVAPQPDSFFKERLDWLIENEVSVRKTGEGYFGRPGYYLRGPNLSTLRVAVFNDPYQLIDAAKGGLGRDK